MSLTPESRFNTSFVVLDNDAYTTSESVYYVGWAGGLYTNPL